MSLSLLKRYFYDFVADANEPSFCGLVGTKGFFSLPLVDDASSPISLRGLSREETALDDVLLAGWGWGFGATMPFNLGRAISMPSLVILTRVVILSSPAGSIGFGTSETLGGSCGGDGMYCSEPG